jgi:hypothetical protein
VINGLEKERGKKMNFLIENNYIEEKKCGNNLAYILVDNNQFLSTEYKVLQSQGEGCFVKTMKMMANGKIQFYYLINGYKSLANMIPTLDAESFMTIVSNLLLNINEVKNNGFLSCRNIDISFEHIFVDQNTFKVSLLYLPANIHFFQDESAFENELRTSLVKLISNISTIESPKTIQFSADLSNGMITLQELLLRVNSGKGEIRKQPVASLEAKIQIVTMNAPERIAINITKDEFVIGKKAELVDCAISFNKMISRVHCKINRTSNGYTVTDLQSTNGTYVNRVKLQSNVPHPIGNGDIIRLANSDFQVLVSR